MACVKVVTYGLTTNARAGDRERHRLRARSSSVSSSLTIPHAATASSSAEPQPVDDPVGQPEQVAEREERAHRPQVAASTGPPGPGRARPTSSTRSPPRPGSGPARRGGRSSCRRSTPPGAEGTRPRTRAASGLRRCAASLLSPGRRLASARVTAPLIARVALVVVAVSAAIVLVAWQRSEDALHGLGQGDVLRAERPRSGAAARAQPSTRVEATVPGSSRLVDSGAVLFQEGHPQLAADVLREAVEREPRELQRVGRPRLGPRRVRPGRVGRGSGARRAAQSALPRRRRRRGAAEQHAGEHECRQRDSRAAPSPSRSRRGRAKSERRGHGARDELALAPHRRDRRPRRLRRRRARGTGARPAPARASVSR